MPLACAICGGWWADRFTLAFPFLRACEGFVRAFYDTLFRAAEVAMHQIAGVRLTGLVQGCRMTGIIEAAFPFYGISPSRSRRDDDGVGVAIMLEDANGRQEQRPGRA